MLRHICKTHFNASRMLVCEAIKTQNSENAILHRNKTTIGNELINRHCSTIRDFRTIRDTVAQVQRRSDEQLDEFANDPRNKMKYETVKQEIELFRYEGKPVPKKICSKDMMMLLNLSDRGRRKYLEVLFKREASNENKEKKSCLTDDYKKVDGYDGEQLSYGLHKNAMFMRIYKQTINRFHAIKVMYEIQHENPLVFDLDYKTEQNYRESAACAKQLKLAFAANRLHRQPFHMYMCGATENDNTLRHLFSHIPTMYDESFPLSISEKPYTELFDKSKLVYLTPHTNRVLTKFNPDAIYIIGGIVDIGESIPHSLAKAKKQGIKTARLPLDEYVSWGLGKKSLTLDQMVNIMLDLRATNDWHQALQHIPKRKLYARVDRKQYDRNHRSWQNNNLL